MEFIDIHTHGAGRYDSRGGTSAILGMAALHGRAGVGAIVPTIYTGPIEAMRTQLASVAEAMRRQWDDPALRKGHAIILGAHLEGPFLNPARSGALDRKNFIRPTLSAARELIKGHEGIVRIVTIAPEVRGALRVIEHLAGLGIRVQMGHSMATLSQAREGMRAGARGVTHLFNAMPQLHHREPGLVGCALMEPSLYVELIGDLVHVSPEVVRMVFKLKGPERVILVSDSVKGPAMVKGVLQGGKAFLPEIAKRLQQIGIPKAEAAATKTPKQYLSSVI